MANILLITAIFCYFLVYDVIFNVLFLFSARFARFICNISFHLYAEITLAAVGNLCGSRGKLIRFPPSITLPDSFIVVANHQTLVDILAITLLFRTHHVRFIAKDYLSKYIPGIRSFLITQRHACINRSITSRSDIATIKRKIARMANPKNQPKKTCYVLFPEGTRAKTEEMLPFKRFGFKLLRDALPGVPIVTVAIQGGAVLGKLKNLLVRTSGERYTVKAVALHTPSAKPSSSEEMLQTLEQEIRDAKKVLKKQQAAY